MQILAKILISVGIILVATAIGKKLPSTAGLIGVMPLTGALVLVRCFPYRGAPPFRAGRLHFRF